MKKNLTLELSGRFKRDYKKIAKHPEYIREDLIQLLRDLVSQQSMPDRYNEHKLEKKDINYAGMTECHLSADIVVVYRHKKGAMLMARIGSHIDIFSVKAKAKKPKPKPKQKERKSRKKAVLIGHTNPKPPLSKKQTS